MATIQRISEENATPKADVVFIHGLWGDAEGTWKHLDSKHDGAFASFWPMDLADDHKSVAVWTVGYDSSPTHWAGHNMPLLDRANSLLDLLNANDIGSRPLLFITHSLGGLLAKAILRASHETPSDDDKHELHLNARGVVFFSTPHTGSSLANLVKCIPGGRSTSILQELSQADPYLRNLCQWFSDKGKEFDYKCLTYYESQKTKGLTVVDAVSANPNHGMRPVPFDGDHFSVCKIPDRSDQRYKQVLKLLHKITENTKTPDPEFAHSETIENIDFEIGVLPNPPQDGKVIEHHPPSRTLSYVSMASPTMIKISPKMGYLEQIKNREALDPVAYFWNPFKCQFPSLDVVLVNNTEKTLVLSEATLEVKSSKPDFSPVIVVPSNTWDMKLTLKNEGWGKISNAVLRCNILPTSSQEYAPDPPINHIEIGDNFSHVFQLGDFAECTELDLRETFKELGVDTETIAKAGFRNQTIDAFNAMKEGRNVKIAKHIGRFPNTETDEAWAVFPDGYAVVAGLLDFESTNVSGEETKVTLPIRARVFLFNIRYDQPMPPSYQYSAELEHTGINYEVPIKLCQTLKAGDADRFTIRLACTQSAFHQFRIRWNFVGGLNSRSYPIQLHHFVPRTFSREEMEFAESGGLAPEIGDFENVFEGDCVEKTLINTIKMAQLRNMNDRPPS
ncbi:esterase/lipase family protein [Roseimaritima ulvae]|uniref:Alpha/beta hydrolase family protein n=1 Tax=Roseimaritima ulvae TaxID=980254 RepID=A0A5B9R1R7_9BACT|nr:alpha/beta hydrolase [Roseimaritima ulvae]QEG43755.1 Alpha/beta hydrolase family protein [Roseimaritima ulvae]